ncbi:GFA family protein [Phenylobacterium sp. J367]|uniref:GFA family protein n=1 Tax=Phenylobacterium sp. J367 TaxID=2898435 RepID=UPI0021510B74|nr:GFA family protein [Phenylobacterium sp. J367]MCR5878416.1 GFA family protein [Phenylobacterium sp. J367]
MPTTMPLPIEGGCRCGQVRFRITGAPLMTMACHCTGCQRMTASAYSLSVMVPADGFEVIAGETVAGGLREPPMHRFCAHCMSWMFTEPPGAAWLVNVRATLLDDASWFTPWMETYTTEALPWAKTPAVKSFEKFPEMDQWQGLVAEHQAQ